MDNKVLADLLLPKVDHLAEHYENLYPPRTLCEGGCVTRFAPSPTGFLHIGCLFAALISKNVALQSGGVFYLRIEDTDKKREMEDGVAEIISGLCTFGVSPDEGAMADGGERGVYGPYTQSLRKAIYHSFAKLLIEKGLAYPCFCNEEDMGGSRKEQESLKLRTGYFSKWAKCRDLKMEEILRNIESGKSFVLRLKSPGCEGNRIHFEDLIKGKIEMPENDMDIILLKSDLMPTYHFAHVVDDHLMRTTHVIRGDEWISSAPIHLQLFEVLGFVAPRYAHISPVMKEEEGGKRKLSKRKDPEAAVSYYHEQGYCAEAVMEYLMTLSNSNFEEWRKENATAKVAEFPFALSKMSVSGALFDLVKLKDISKNVVSRMSAEQVYEQTCLWADEYDKQLQGILKTNEAYAKAILAIERGCEKPRKDIGCWGDVKEYISYFYHELWQREYDFPPHITKQDVGAILETYAKEYTTADDKDQWFERLKSVCEPLGFSPDVKGFKKNPNSFKGHIGDVSTIIRIAITSRRNTPDLFEILRLLGHDEVKKRLLLAIEHMEGIE